jgi:hypothetical protein
MKDVSLLLTFILICMKSQCQYSYFNNNYFIEDGLVGSALDNIVVLEDGLLIHGYVADSEGSNEYYTKTDYQGNVLWSSSQLLSEGTFRYLSPFDVFKKCTSGFIISITEYTELYPITNSVIIKLNENMEEEWQFTQYQYQNDSVSKMEYSGLMECENGDFIAFGDVTYNTEQGEQSSYLLSRISQTGNEIWSRKYPNSQGQLISSNQFFIKSTEIFELGNGDFLGMFGRRMNNELIPSAILFDENGNFVDSISWGDYETVDGVPYAIHIGDDNFLYIYQHANGSFFNSEPLTQPRAGIISMYADGNINTQFPMFNHEMAWGRINDLEQCFDSNYLVLGSGAVPGLMNHAFLLQMDENGVEQWYQQYTPPIPYYSLEVFDLEVCPDGGYVFGGYCLGIEPNKQMYWLVKTDACGDVEYDGCWPVTSVLQEPTAERNFSVYPNPAEDLITISLSSTQSESEYLSISVRDIEGNLVHSFDRINRQTEINLDISKWSSGAYHITIVNSCTQAVISQRFVKL